jgi:uncharacterized protein HemX
LSPETKELVAMLWPALSLFANLWMFFAMRKIEAQKASEARMSTLEGVMAKIHSEHAVRITRLESAAKTAVSNTDIKELHERINELSQEVHKLAGSMNGWQRTLSLIEEFLLRNGARP